MAKKDELESAILRAERDEAIEKLGECHAGYETLRKELAAAQAERDEAREAYARRARQSEPEMLSALLSFAARVAADQRERDAKIAETPDPQLANKTAAQIAAAIRASAKPF